MSIKPKRKTTGNLIQIVSLNYILASVSTQGARFPKTGAVATVYPNIQQRSPSLTYFDAENINIVTFNVRTLNIINQLMGHT